jgi:GR25 family glycosyltransferase involved in LPS biosynthesis
MRVQTVLLIFSSFWRCNTQENSSTRDKIAGVDAVYVINLDRRTDRLEEFYSRYPFSDQTVTRIAAVDGRELDGRDSRLGLFAVNKWGTTEWPIGLVGATLSHYEVWKRVVQNKTIDRALVFEDDVRFSKSFITKWHMHISPRLQTSRFDVLYIGGRRKQGCIRHREGLSYNQSSFIRPVRGALCELSCHAYIVSSVGAAKLLQWAEYPKGGVDRSIDCWILDAVPLLDIWAAWDLVCHSIPSARIGTDEASVTDIDTPEIIDVVTGRRRMRPSIDSDTRDGHSSKPEL